MDIWRVGHDTPGDVIAYINDWKVSCPHPPVLCFDYFDTLIVRRVEPEHTKRLAASLQEKIFQNSISANELYTIRQRIEKYLCEQSVAAGGEPEFDYVTFCHRFLQELQGLKISGITSWQEHKFSEMLLNIELAVELGVQEVCEETVQVLRTIKETGIITVLASDFYLPGKYFRKMIQGHQLEDLFDHVFISTDHGLMKGTGRMYKHICEELACRPDQLLMIGDNVHADVVMAREHGCKAIHVQNVEQQKLYSHLVDTPKDHPSFTVLKFEKALEKKSVFAEIGYSLWHFTFLLFEQLVANNVKDVFFFSKEGEFLKKIFDCFQKDVYEHIVVHSHYIFVSRKATFLASLRPLEQEDFLRLFAHYRDISLRDFLLSLNFDEKLSQALCEENGLDFHARRSDLRSHQEFEALLGSERFRRKYEQRRKQQKINFTHYLDSFQVNYLQEGLTIVDVGWKGSIQDNVYHSLDGHVNVQGYFLGSLIATELLEKNRKTGLLFSDWPEPSPFFNVYNNNRSLLEMVLGASHGSADGYYIDKECEASAGELGQVIQLSVPTSHDVIQVMTLDLPEERKLFQDVIQPIQDAFLQLAGRLNNTYLTAGCTTPDPEWFARQHARVVFRPTRAEVELFESLYHLENFGIFEFTNFLSENVPSLKQRLIHLKNVLQHRDVLESGLWPPIILRRLGIGFFHHFDGRSRYRREFKGK